MTDEETDRRVSADDLEIEGLLEGGQSHTTIMDVGTWTDIRAVARYTRTDRKSRKKALQLASDRGAKTRFPHGHYAGTAENSARMAKSGFVSDT